MKKSAIIAIGLIVVLGLIYIFLPSSKKSTDSLKPGEIGEVYFKFTDLPDGIMAKSGSFEVTEREVSLSPSMDAFLSKKKDVQFVLIYQQFVSRAKKPVKTLNLRFSKVSRSVSSLLNQYGVKLQGGTKIQFSSPNLSEAIAEVDSQKIYEKDIDYNNFIWGSLATEIFHFKLASVDKILKQKILKAEAQKLGVSEQKFREDHVYKRLIKKISKKDIDTYLKTYSMEDNDFNRRATRDRLLLDRKKRALDYILEKYLIKFPILVDVKKPNFSLEIKEEWTPRLGKGPLKITFLGGTREKASAEWLEKMIPVLGNSAEISFYYRPVFLASNKLQNTITQAHLCVWQTYPQKFWRYFQLTLGSLDKQTENKLYGALEKLNLKVEPIKKCLVNQSMQKVVQYHNDYANYLGIHLGPIVYVGGEVLHGRILAKDVKHILERQLGRPTGGLWKRD